MQPGLQVTCDSPEARAEPAPQRVVLRVPLGSTEPTLLAPCSLVCGEPEETIDLGRDLSSSFPGGKPWCFTEMHLPNTMETSEPGQAFSKIPGQETDWGFDGLSLSSLSVTQAAGIVNRVLALDCTSSV